MLLYELDLLPCGRLGWIWLVLVEGRVVHAGADQHLEAETGGLLQVQSQPGL